MSFIVAIDGPSGSGKGTIATAVAKKLDLLYLDTGAMYRCVTLKILKENISFDDIEAIKKVLKEIKIDFKSISRDDAIKLNEKLESKIDVGEGFTPERVYLDGEDVTKQIREKEVTQNTSTVAKILEVRLAMVDLQRKICSKRDSILDGRDIGTNVFPNADVKIYLDASVDERVRRRIRQNKEKGILMSENEVRESITARDKADKEREHGALKQANDAIYVDTTNYPTIINISRVCKIVRKGKKKYDRIQNAYIMTKETPAKKIRRSFTKNFLALLYHIVYRVKKNGIENIQGDEGIIICANHVNYLDAAGIILLNKRYITFVAKHDLFRIGILSTLGHLFNIIPVKRDSSDVASLKLCLKSLKNKEALGIFPEGTRHGLEKNAEIKNGAAFLAYKAKVKVVPVGVKGSFKPFTKVIFNYGKPIDVSSFKTDDPNWINNATKYIMDRIIELSK